MTRQNVFENNDPTGDQYPHENGALVGWFDPVKAERFPEDTRWNGNNFVSVHTRDQFVHQALYRTAQGRWVRNTWSQREGGADVWAFIDDDAARTWLLLNGDDAAVERLLGPVEAEVGPGRPSIGIKLPVKFHPDVRTRLEADATRQGVGVAEVVRQIVDAHYAASVVPA